MLSALSGFYLDRAKAAVRSEHFLKKFRETNKQYSYWNDFDAAMEYAKKAVPDYPFFAMSQITAKAATAYNAGEYELALAAYDDEEKYWESKGIAFCKRRGCEGQMLIMADEFRRERAKIFIKVGQWEKALPQINVT